MAGDCVQGEANKTKIENLEKELTEHKEDFKVFENKIWDAVDGLREDLIKRPSWAVCFWITATTSLSLSLLGILVTTLLK